MVDTYAYTYRLPERRRATVHELLTPAQCADLADLAADVLEREGWIQGNTHRPDGHCAIGALECAARRESEGLSLADRSDAVVGVAQLISDMLGVRTLPRYNDAPARTADEVITALRDFAIKTRPDLTGGPDPAL